MTEVRIGIIGVGNCARALIEGIAHYTASDGPGLMHCTIGPYLPRHIVPAAAWDVDASKVDQPLHIAITAGQNLNVGIDPTDLELGSDVIVQRGPTLDGAGRMYRDRIHLAADHPNYDGTEIRQQIRDANVDVLLNYLPVGS